VENILHPDSGQLHEILGLHARFVGLANPETYAESRLKIFDDQQILSVANYCKIYIQDGQILASAYFHPGGWIQDIYIRDTDAFSKIVKNENIISEEEGELPYYLSFANYPKSTHEKIRLSLKEIGYHEDTDYNLKLSVFGLAFELHNNYMPWNEERDHQFSQAYSSLSENPFPWNVIKFQTGGGHFDSDYWYLEKSENALVGINSPSRTKVDEKVYNLIVCAGSEEYSEKLLSSCLYNLSSFCPEAIVFTHCLSAKLGFYQKFGFEVISSFPYFKIPK
jgi:hypothetical protein